MMKSDNFGYVREPGGLTMLLTFVELCSFLKEDGTTVISLIEAGCIPPPVSIGNRLVRWVESDLVRWVQTGCPSFPPLTPDELALIRRQTTGDDRSGESRDQRDQMPPG
jgi:predicted DNA-binding transcriptional regulator AlpA